jgi:hypothetical protein
MAVVVIDNGTEVHLPLKSSEIVRALIEISAEIERLSAGHVAFHLKGRSVIPELTKRYRPHRGDEPADKK